MLISCRRIVAALAVLASLSPLAGCGVQQIASLAQGSDSPVYTPAGAFLGHGFGGTVMAGTQPLRGAQVQLYAAGTAGNGSAPTQLLSAALTTNTGGAFQVAAGSYTCPTAASVLYVVATGGSTGSEAPNRATKLITVPGACNSLGEDASFVLNELTTAATVYALRPFLGAGGQLGSTPTNVQGLNLAVATLGRLADLTHGTATGNSFPANGTAPATKLNSFANVLHGCTADAPACAALFIQTALSGAQPANTLDAALAVANRPDLTLGPLTPAGSPFVPALIAAPPDWTLAIPFTGGGMQGPASVSIDASGQVWVTNYFGVASLFANSGAPVFTNGLTGAGMQESYGGAVDSLGRMWVANEQNNDTTVNNGIGSISVLGDAGPALPGTSMFSSGGLNFPVALGFDRVGNAWIVDYGNSHVTILNSSGVPQSGATGYVSDQFVFPVAVAADSKGNGWLANQSASTVTRVTPDGSTFTSYTVGDAPSAVAVDASDNIWTANFYGNSVGLVSAAGKVISGAGFVGGGVSHPTGIALDGNGTAWVANYRAPGISAFSGMGAPAPGTALTGDNGWGSDVRMLEAFGVAIDAAGDVWVTSYGDNRLVEYVGVAAPVATPLLGGVRVP